MVAPNRGDLVWLDFSPHLGREQGGRRPALVLSSRAYHQLTGYVVACPITTTIRGWNFEVVLPEGLPVKGAILTDHIKNLDRHARKIEKIGMVPKDVLEEVQAKIVALLGIEDA